MCKIGSQWHVLLVLLPGLTSISHVDHYQGFDIYSTLLSTWVRDAGFYLSSLYLYNSKGYNRDDMKQPFYSLCFFFFPK